MAKVKSIPPSGIVLNPYGRAKETERALVLKGGVSEIGEADEKFVRGWKEAHKDDGLGDLVQIIEEPKAAAPAPVETKPAAAETIAPAGETTQASGETIAPAGETAPADPGVEPAAPVESTAVEEPAAPSETPAQ